MFDTAEAQFLIAIVRHDDPRKLQEELRNVCTKTIDWQELTLPKRLAAVMYLKTKEFYKEIGVPQDVFEKWKTVYLTTILMNTYIAKDMETISEKFKRNTIDYIFLKGAAELVTVYKDDPGLRPMVDVDILVNPSDVNVAENILVKEMKYSLFYSDEHERSYVKETYLRIDLHWELFQKKDLSLKHLDMMAGIMKGCFESKKAARCNGSEIFIPDPASLLTLLIMHEIKPNHFPGNIYWELYAQRKAGYGGQRTLGIISFAYSVKHMAQYFGNTIDWARVGKNFQGFEKDPRVKLLLSVCRVCGIEIIPEGFYSIFKVPERISEHDFKRLARDVDTFFLVEWGFRRMITRQASLERLLGYSLLYICGLKFTLRIKHLYKKFSGRPD